MQLRPQDYVLGSGKVVLMLTLGVIVEVVAELKRMVYWGSENHLLLNKSWLFRANTISPSPIVRIPIQSWQWRLPSSQRGY